MNTKFGFFPYGAMNYKSAQAQLDRRAAQGWELRHIYLGCIARFRRADRPSHFVDLDMRGGLDGDADYFQLCSDAGWELVQALRGMLLFRAAAGQSPAPIQTDGELEWERFWEKHRPRLLSTLITLISIGVIAFVLAMPPRQWNVPAMLAANLGLLYLLYFVLAILYALAQWIHSRWYLAKCRRTDRVEDPGPLATALDSLDRLQTPLLCLILFFTVAQPMGLGRTVDLEWYSPTETYTATVEACREWPVVTAADLGLGDSGYSRHLDGHSSPLMEFLEYRELAQTAGRSEPVYYILTTERYGCATELLARWTLAQRHKETQNGYFLWGDLDWESAPGLGFDESYTCREGAYLLLRQGRVVALVGCDGLDLTQPQALETVRARVLG